MSAAWATYFSERTLPNRLRRPCFHSTRISAHPRAKARSGSPLEVPPVELKRKRGRSEARHTDGAIQEPDMATHTATTTHPEPEGLLSRAVLQLRQFMCGLHGHDTLKHFERGRISLLCASCGHETPGW